MMKIKDIREKTDAELSNLLADLRKEKMNLAIQSRTGQLENSARIKGTRRDIAKVMTELSARSVANS
jgi:large subunit ribosomal protein L29